MNFKLAQLQIWGNRYKYRFAVMHPKVIMYGDNRNYDEFGTIEGRLDLDDGNWKEII